MRLQYFDEQPLPITSVSSTISTSLCKNQMLSPSPPLKTTIGHFDCNYRGRKIKDYIITMDIWSTVCVGEVKNFYDLIVTATLSRDIHLFANL